MSIRELNAYAVQSETTPEKWYEVILGTPDTPERTKCSCPDYVHRDKICEHIEKALGIRALDL